MGSREGKPVINKAIDDPWTVHGVSVRTKGTQTSRTEIGKSSAEYNTKTTLVHPSALTSKASKSPKLFHPGDPAKDPSKGQHKNITDHHKPQPIPVPIVPASKKIALEFRFPSDNLMFLSFFRTKCSCPQSKCSKDQNWSRDKY